MHIVDLYYLAVNSIFKKFFSFIYLANLVGYRYNSDNQLTEE
ncbi:hypothetical protein [Escherichia phage 19-1-2]|nr:hypothetical protein [Escherichia phage 19-1-2]